MDSFKPAEMLDEILRQLEPYSATLVAVSKTKTVDEILAVYQRGIRHFGENRARELEEKQNKLPDDIIWHMIGHLQKNKVKYIAEFVHFIHSVDSFDLLKTVEKQAKKHNRCIKVLLQFKIAREESKYGLDMEEAVKLIQEARKHQFTHVKIVGLMGMATFTDKEDIVRQEFSQLKTYFDNLKENLFLDDPSFSEISMGMSGDYPIALEEGATMVRIGSLIFGARNY